MNFNLGTIPAFQGQKITEKIGIISIAGANKVLTAHGVRHAFVRHQAKQTENDRGQIGITESDFEFLPQILSSPDEVRKGDSQHRRKQDIIKFSKKIKGNTYHVLVSISRSKHNCNMVFNTMFIVK